MKKAFSTIFAAVLLLGNLGLQAHAATPNADAPSAPVLGQSIQTEAVITPIADTTPSPTTVNTTAPIADKTIVEIKGNRHFVVKTFERTLDTDEANPSALKEEPFVLDGYLYTFFDLQKEAVPVVERKLVSETVTMETSTDDTTAILQQLAAEMSYGEGADGFYGTLTLNHASIRTTVKEYEAKSFTLTDSQTFNGLSDTDPITIPKIIVKSGVTLKLQDVNWSVQETMVVGYDTVPSKYSATASYSGSYSKNVPVGYMTTAQYTGEVGKSHIEKIVYTVTYLGEAIATTDETRDGNTSDGVDGSDNPADIPADSKDSKSHLPESTTFGWMVALGCILLVGTGIAVFFYLRRNVAIYAKENDTYKLLTWRYVKSDTPTVDLRHTYIATAEAAICVKQSLANRLFGRHITTIISDDWDVKCLVDKQGADFWYVVDMTDTADALDIDDTAGLDESTSRTGVKRTDSSAPPLSAPHKSTSPKSIDKLEVTK